MVGQMSFAEFAAAIAGPASAPPELGPALAGLWHDARGDWVRAHEEVQNDAGAEAAWVHAYLHRKEGDPGNAAYWYSRAGRSRPEPDVTLQQEWEQIARALLAAGQRG